MKCITPSEYLVEELLRDPNMTQLSTNLYRFSTRRKNCFPIRLEAHTSGSDMRSPSLGGKLRIRGDSDPSPPTFVLREKEQSLSSNLSRIGMLSNFTEYMIAKIESIVLRDDFSFWFVDVSSTRLPSDFDRVESWSLIQTVWTGLPSFRNWIRRV